MCSEKAFAENRSVKDRERGGGKMGDTLGRREREVSDSIPIFTYFSYLTGVFSANT